MSGPLSRYIRQRRPDEEMQLYKQAVTEHWTLPEEQQKRVLDNLAAIAANPRQPSRALKAAGVLQRAHANEQAAQIEWFRLIMQDEMADARAEGVRTQINVANVSLDQVHEMLETFVTEEPPSEPPPQLEPPQEQE